MSRKRIATAAGLVLLALVLFGPPAGRAQDAAPGPRMKLGLGFEYFSRTLAWDDDTRSSVMTAALGCLRLDYEIQKGFSLAAFARIRILEFQRPRLPGPSLLARLRSRRRGRVPGRDRSGKKPVQRRGF